MEKVRLVWDGEDRQYVEPHILEAKQKEKQREQDDKIATFLRGPIPMQWLESAAKLPGKAIHVGLAIWFVRGLVNQSTFKLKRKTVERFGVSRRAFYQGLMHLEQAELISVERKPGQLTVITILYKTKT